MPDYFFIRIDGRYVKVLFRDILFVESRRNYVRLVLPNRFFLTQLSLKQLCHFLPREHFCQVHRSYIAGMNFVESFDQNTILLTDRQLPAKQYQLPIGEKYRQHLLDSIPLVTSESRSTKRYPAVTAEGLLCAHEEEIMEKQAFDF